MRHLFENIKRMVEKRRLSSYMVHEVMLQYILNLDPRSEEMRAFLDLITDEDIDFMGSLPATRSGSAVVCYALALGTAKVG
jgi:predicted ribonuclease YlaK